jgi:hypothetical protein
MISRYSLKTLFITSIALLAVLISRAQLASQKPMPKKSDWMSKVQQNRSTAQKQLSSHKTTTVLPATPGMPQNPQPSATQQDRRIPVYKPAGTTQPPTSSGQKSQIPVRQKAKDGGR